MAPRKRPAAAEPEQPAEEEVPQDTVEAAATDDAEADATEPADERGDARAIYQGARILSGKSNHQPSPQPSKKGKGKGDMIQTSEELGEVCQQFLSGKFKVPELKIARYSSEPTLA